MRPGRSRWTQIHSVRPRPATFDEGEADREPENHALVWGSARRLSLGSLLLHPDYARRAGARNRGPDAADDASARVQARCVAHCWPGFETVVVYEGERLVAVVSNPVLGFASDPFDMINVFDQRDRAA